MLEHLTYPTWTWLPWTLLAVFAFPAWHIQWLTPLIYYLVFQVPTDVAPDCLFAPNVRVSRCYPFACDINNHKSNSTYFADVDISQVELIARLISRGFIARKKQGKIVTPRLGAVGGVFLKEIKIWQGYRVSSRVLAWDEKWLYIMTRFESAGKISQATENNTQQERRVYAIMMTKLVFKQGRETVPPQTCFVESGLIPKIAEEVDGRATELSQDKDARSNGKSPSTKERIEEIRQKGLDIVRNMLTLEVLKDEEALGSMEGTQILNSMF